MVGHLLEHHPAVVKLHDIIEKGELGKIQYIYSNRLNFGKIRIEEDILWSFAQHDISAILLLLVYSGVLFLESSDGGMSLTRFLYILPFALMLNIVAMFSGLYIPRMLGLVLRDQATIAVDVGLQNSTLAIFVAGTLLDNYTIATVAVVYGSFTFFTTWAFGYLAKKYL